MVDCAYYRPVAASDLLSWRWRGCEALASDRDFDRLVGLEVAVPVRRAAEPGDDDYLARGVVLTDHFQHRLVAAPGSSADVCEPEEPATEDSSCAPVVEVRGTAQQFDRRRSAGMAGHG